MILRKISTIFVTTPFDEPITLTCNAFTALQGAFPLIFFLFFLTASPTDCNEDEKKVGERRTSERPRMWEDKEETFRGTWNTWHFGIHWSLRARDEVNLSTKERIFHPSLFSTSVQLEFIQDLLRITEHLAYGKAAYFFFPHFVRGLLFLILNL